MPINRLIYEENVVYTYTMEYLSIYLFLAALGLRCHARAFSSCGEQGLLFVVVHGLLIAVACLCYGAWTQGTWPSVIVAHRL